MSDADPRCPECGGKIGRTATYCMHCSADLTGARDAADANDDGTWDEAAGGATGPDESDDAADGSSPSDRTSGRDDTSADVPWANDDEGDDAEPTWGPDADSPEGSGGEGDETASGADTDSAAGGDGEPMLDPDGLVDNSLTVLVGIGGGVVVGIVGTIALLVITGSGWGFLVGILAWLGSTAYLVRRRTVQGAVAKSGYAVAAVLLVLPFVAFSPLADVDGGLTGRVVFFVVTLFGVAVPAGIAAGVGYIASRYVPTEAEETPT